jgi:hypothetical protein
MISVCNPNNLEGQDRRIVSSRPAWLYSETMSQKKKKKEKKILGHLPRKPKALEFKLQKKQTNKQKRSW